jgi:hypothetical protein
MHVIRNTGGVGSALSDAIKQAVKTNPRIRLVITGCFQEFTELMGQICEGPGKPLVGSTRPGRAYVGYRQISRMNGSPFFFDIGNLETSYDAGASGLCPMMMMTDDSEYPTKKNAFETHEMFVAGEKAGNGSGRTILARQRGKWGEGLLLAIVQPHHKPGNLNLSLLLEKVKRAGFDDAVAFDGSDSVFCYSNGYWAVGPPPPEKNYRNITAIGFSYDPFISD